MSHYFAVYSPAGELFEVTEEKAADLRLNHGWLTSPPAPKAAPIAKVVEDAKKVFIKPVVEDKPPAE
jgi:hypothetical protein